MSPPSPVLVTGYEPSVFTPDLAQYTADLSTIDI
jgi:hypothetical protein